MTARTVIYARYSSDLSRDASIEDQVRLCRAHAERQGWQVVRVFEDRAISGASAIRPGYQAMLEAVQSGTVDIVLAESLDRLSRDQEDIAALFKRLRFLGVKLVTVGEGEVGDLHVGLKGAMNALYLKDLADKTRRGFEGRVRAGGVVAVSATAMTSLQATSAAGARSTRARRASCGGSSRSSPPAGRPRRSRAA